jgi:hypothetical protein
MTILLYAKYCHRFEQFIYIEIGCHSWVLAIHACNPSYSGGRDQEDHGSKPALPNSLRDPISKKPITKKGWWNGSM